MPKIPVTFEMETSDPDDFMTLLWLADHPQVNLLAVVVTPGSYDQCVLVKHGLEMCGREDAPVGALHGPSWWNTEVGKKKRVSDFHYRVNVYDPDYLKTRHDVDPQDIYEGPDLLDHIFRSWPTCVHLTGAPPKNLAATFDRYPDVTLSRWVMQGGFAGDNMVEPQHRLEKFAGKLTCPSFNPGGAPKHTLSLLANPRISAKQLVSKNVCHGVVWDERLQEKLHRETFYDEGGPIRTYMRGPVMYATTTRPVLTPVGDLRNGLRTVVDALDEYLEAKGRAKAMHDLVAAACVVEPSICTFKTCKVYREKGAWGAEPVDTSDTSISVAIDLEKFCAVLAT